MGEKEIVTYGEQVLRARAEEIEEIDDEIKELIQRMYRIMAENDGVGLAGPQVGVSKRIFTYDVGDGPHALINPEILNPKGEETAAEGCLSIPGLHGEVTRALEVTATGINEKGEKVKIRAEGLLARVFQHETDHLDGKMFIDRADPSTLETVPLDEKQDVDL